MRVWLFLAIDVFLRIHLRRINLKFIPMSRKNFAGCVVWTQRVVLARGRDIAVSHGDATFGDDIMTRILTRTAPVQIARLALLSGKLPRAERHRDALRCAGADRANGQGASSSLPPVTVTAPETRRRSSSASGPRSQQRRAQPPDPNRAAARGGPGDQSPSRRRRMPAPARSGYYANSTSVATKTNTPLINIPQSAQRA